MDLRESDDVREFRNEAREWLAANVPRHPLPSGDTAAGFAAHVEWERTLHEAGWSVVDWPREYGGRGASVWRWLAFEEEYHQVGAPTRVTQNGRLLLGPALLEYGTDEQKRMLLPRIAAAQDLWCQGWSEPEAGSDLAAIRSRARPADDGWLLSGQKTWTTRGAFCTHLFGLFRSDERSSRHRGLTYFLVPLDAPGVTVRPFQRFDGDDGFAEVFFDDVHVPHSAVLGGVGAGWSVAMSTTSSERGLTLRSPARFLATAERLVCEAFAGRTGSPRQADRATEAWIHARAYQDFTLHQVTRALDGADLGSESSLNKIIWSELDIRLHEAALDLAPGPDEVDQDWAKGFQFSLAGPIYAGTNEIQRNIVAQRVLGLPRSPRPTA
jgi:alkylation response protein AidB-like acyl-CoA dehydrogenase